MNRDSRPIKTKFKAANTDQQPKIFLALQGGGSHGAFTAGVIEALHDAGILKHIKGISGVSAGAFNAAPLSYALNIGRPELAPALINKAWDGVAQSGKSSTTFNSLARTASHFTPFMSKPARYPNLPRDSVNNMTSFVQMAQIMGMRSQSGDIKARMRDIIPDWNPIQNGEIETVIGATRVTNRGGTNYLSRAYFYNADIDSDAVAASATLIGTHKKGGESFVDGGYTSNPPLEPFTDGDYTDVIAIMLSPLPKSPLVPAMQSDLMNGQNFLHDEVYAELAHITMNSGKNVHVIDMKHEPHWDETSKMNAEPAWIDELKTRGYQAGVQWAATYAKDLGKRSTFDPEIADSLERGLDRGVSPVAS